MSAVDRSPPAAQPKADCAPLREQEKLAFEHAWRHFALHAGQRIAVFNFYVASSGLLVSGLAYVLVSRRDAWPMGLLAGIALVGLSLIFWKLDQRSKQIIGVSERVMETIELHLVPRFRVAGEVAELPVNTSRLPFRGRWSFGRSFRLLFFTVALIGTAGAFLSVALSGVIRS